MCIYIYTASRLRVILSYYSSGPWVLLFCGYTCMYICAWIYIFTQATCVYVYTCAQRLTFEPYCHATLPGTMGAAISWIYLYVVCRFIYIHTHIFTYTHEHSDLPSSNAVMLLFQTMGAAIAGAPGILCIVCSSVFGLVQVPAWGVDWMFICCSMLQYVAVCCIVLLIGFSRCVVSVHDVVWG